MNHQREQFRKQVDVEKEKMRDGKPESGSGDGGGKHTKIEHHEDGTHTVHHADGEKSGPHPSMAHAMMHMVAKHEGGEHGHIMPHAAGATTHHVGVDGEVQGPHEHGSEDEAYSHMKNSIGESAGMDGDGMSGGDYDGDESSFE